MSYLSLSIWKLFCEGCLSFSPLNCPILCQTWWNDAALFLEILLSPSKFNFGWSNSLFWCPEHALVFLILSVSWRNEQQRRRKQKPRFLHQCRSYLHVFSEKYSCKATCTGNKLARSDQFMLWGSCNSGGAKDILIKRLGFPRPTSVGVAYRSSPRRLAEDCIRKKFWNSEDGDFFWTSPNQCGYNAQSITPL